MFGTKIAVELVVVWVFRSSPSSFSDSIYFELFAITNVRAQKCWQKRSEKFGWKIGIATVQTVQTVHTYLWRAPQSQLHCNMANRIYCYLKWPKLNENVEQPEAITLHTKCLACHYRMFTIHFISLCFLLFHVFGCILWLWWCLSRSILERYFARVHRCLIKRRNKSNESTKRKYTKCERIKRKLLLWVPCYHWLS